MQGLEITPTTVSGTIDFITDCNLNGVPDGDDISGGNSVDCDGDGIPDECGFDPALPGLQQRWNPGHLANQTAMVI